MSERRAGPYWEVGGGWGDFARLLSSTLFPDVTYTDHLAADTPAPLRPRTVMTLFPEAPAVRILRVEAGGDSKSTRTASTPHWPDTAVGELVRPPPRCTLDIGTLERMTASRIDAHVQRAFDLGCRYMLSVCLGRGNSERARSFAHETGMDASDGGSRLSRSPPSRAKRSVPAGVEAAPRVTASPRVVLGYAGVRPSRFAAASARVAAVADVSGLRLGGC